ncbi:nucleotide sugar dehydrogenase [Methylobacterium sp. J-077]|uniref:nucleotide sugar dehydrogenase n=1 Tax=Methylobacterium sp. J-077 TaxID=2836656 RepID=UPI001FBB6D9E|nr:nucleotide sugar dehydrogenase [Methylobacterium sp. J-077]MCJ2126404.1 nucleotide sugar dehydrogenase [Methylobacterium sp. J-077]
MAEQTDRLVNEIVERFAKRKAVIGIIGLGYVGLPLALTAADRDFSVLGFDVDSEKIDQLENGRSYIKHIEAETVSRFVKSGRFRVTSDFSRLSEVDAIILCVPTPLTKQREPDLSFVEMTTRSVLPHLHKGQIVILESTTYPGTTRDVMQPILESGGLKSGTDFFLAYSPEREDPGNPNFATRDIPKVVGGHGTHAQRIAATFYDAIVTRTVAVSSLETAEAVKLTENIFRSVNIALVNELKVVFEAMGIDVWEVIEAAKTKPFGFMPFYPGPGLGGHCIPIDPFYLTWKAREHGVVTRFIELAGEVNTAMPLRVVDRVVEGLSDRLNLAVKGAKVLIVGLAYKKNVDDVRESPAFKIIELLAKRGAKVTFYDPYLDTVPSTRDHPAPEADILLSWDEVSLAGFDVAVICTDHDDVDYALLAKSMRLIIDTRNVCARQGLSGPNILKA